MTSNSHAAQYTTTTRSLNLRRSSSISRKSANCLLLIIRLNIYILVFLRVVVVSDCTFYEEGARWYSRLFWSLLWFFIVCQDKHTSAVQHKTLDFLSWQMSTLATYCRCLSEQRQFTSYRWISNLLLFQAFNLEAIVLAPAFGIFAALYIIFPIPAILFASTVR